MDKARFLITGDNEEEVLAKVQRAPLGGLELFAQSDAGSPLYLMDGDLKLLKEFYGADDSLVGILTEDKAKLEDAIKKIGFANPYRWYEPDAHGDFHPVAGPTPKGFTLALHGDPAKLGIERERVVNASIAFADAGASAQQHRAPGLHGGATFMRRAEMVRAIDGAVPPVIHHGVNVVIVDQGMSREYVDALGGAGSYARVLWDPPSAAPPPHELPTEQSDRYRSWPQWHAHMIVRNIFAIAGGNKGAIDSRNFITIYDVPVIPDRVGSVLGTVQEILQQYGAIETAIDNPPPGPRRKWVIVNAWGVKNRLREHPQGEFSKDISDHALNTKIVNLANRQDVAVVFAAGNNGLFTPDPAAGPYDKGPFRSVWAPAALDEVWTAGACDPQGLWIGASSQWPSSAARTGQSRNFSMPSYFREDLDAHVLNTGSSASCGLLAGLIVKAWRKDSGALRPGVVRSGSRRRGHHAHNRRLGHGVPQDGTFT